ncbi:hypothetical protein ACLOJK_011348 [Asimina triloba]
MAGKAAAAAKTAAKAVGEYQYPWREKLVKYKDELAKGVWGYWHLGAWKPLAISARRRARLRKEVLLSGECALSLSWITCIPFSVTSISFAACFRLNCYFLVHRDWPYDPPRGEMRTKRKGHKCDRIAAEKRANTAELMKKMPQMLLDYKSGIPKTIRNADWDISSIEYAIEKLELLCDLSALMPAPVSADLIIISHMEVVT